MLKRIEEDTRTAIRELTHRALGCRLKGQYQDAEALYLEALTLAEREFGPKEEALAQLLNDVAVLYKYTGRFADAGRLYVRALRIVKACGRRHAILATLYHNIGGLEHARGRYRRAEVFARGSVAIREKAVGSDQTDLAADIAALAAILEAEGKYSEASTLYCRALATFERTVGSEHYENAVNLNNLGSLNYRLGNCVEAETFYQRALIMKEKLLGPDHPDIAVTLNNLAVLCRSQGRLDEALDLYVKCVSIFRRVLSPTHPKTVTCSLNYAILLRQLGRIPEARAVELSIDAGNLRTDEARHRDLPVGAILITTQNSSSLLPIIDLLPACARCDQ